MLKVEIPGHPSYVINERGQVFHRETKEFVPLLSGKYTLKTEDGTVRISYDSIMKSLEPVIGKKEKKPKKPKKEKKVANENGIHDSDEGKFTLIESVQTCRTFAALEAIVEGNNIPVDLSVIKKLQDQKDAVLEYLA